MHISHNSQGHTSLPVEQRQKEHRCSPVEVGPALHNDCAVKPFHHHRAFEAVAAWHAQDTLTKLTALQNTHTHQDYNIPRVRSFIQLWCLIDRCRLCWKDYYFDKTVYLRSPRQHKTESVWHVTVKYCKHWSSLYHMPVKCCYTKVACFTCLWNIATLK